MCEEVGREVAHQGNRLMPQNILCRFDATYKSIHRFSCRSVLNILQLVTICNKSLSIFILESIFILRFREYDTWIRNFHIITNSYHTKCYHYNNFQVVSEFQNSGEGLCSLQDMTDLRNQLYMVTYGQSRGNAKRRTQWTVYPESILDQCLKRVSEI
jgi:hypothetical protein